MKQAATRRRWTLFGVLTLAGIGAVVLGWAALEGSGGAGRAAPDSSASAATPRVGVTTEPVATGAVERRQPATTRAEEPHPTPPDDGASPPLDGVAPPSEVLATFATDHPNLDAFLDWSEQFARSAEVDPASVVRDPDTGSVEGVLIVPGQGTRAEFSIVNGDYRVSMAADPQMRPALFLRTTDWAFRDGGGLATNSASIVQFHPDTGKSPASFVDAGAERIVGWNLSQSADGAIANPITVRRSTDPDGGWAIGRPLQTPALPQPGLVSTHSHDILLDKLSKFQ